MADEPLTSPAAGLRCEFYECGLSSSGEVLKRSTKARKMMDLDDDNDKLRKQIAALETTITELRAELEAAKTPAVTGSGSKGNDW